MKNVDEELVLSLRIVVTVVLSLEAKASPGNRFGIQTCLHWNLTILICTAISDKR